MNSTKLGILVNYSEAIFQRLVIAGICEIAAQYDYDIVIHESANDQPLSLDIDSLAGLAIIANAVPDALIESIYQTGKPISLISHELPTLPVPVIMSNNAQGIAELVRHLVIQRQRRELVFIRGLMDQNDARQREIAFRQEIIRYGLQVPETHFLRGDFSPDRAAESLRLFIEQGYHFDGIIASDYVMAISTLKVLQEAGLSVPQQVSVVGYGDDLQAEHAGLTTVAANITELGRCAARQLISQIKGLKITGVTMLNVRLIVRETC